MGILAYKHQIPKHFQKGAVRIFPAKQVLEPWMCAAIEKEIRFFLSDWSAHGIRLNTEVFIFFDQFLVIAIENKEAISGCAMDALVRQMKQIDERYDCGFFNRERVSVVTQHQIQTFPLDTLVAQIKAGGDMLSALLLDHSLTEMPDFLTRWLLPVGESWMMRRFICV